MWQLMIASSWYHGIGSHIGSVSVSLPRAADIVRLLVAYRADVTAQDSKQRNPLQRAIEYNHLSVASALLENGALQEQHTREIPEKTSSEMRRLLLDRGTRRMAILLSLTAPH